MAAGAAFALLVSCDTRPASDISATAASPLGSPLIGACCGWEDSTIMAQMRRYETTPEAERPPELAMFPYRVTSGITRRERIVVTDSAQWARLWPDLVGARSPVPALPAVDFSREALVIAAMGQQNTGGYSVSIDSAFMKADTITLVVTEMRPGPSCGTLAMLTAPVALARVRRSRVPIRLIEQSTVVACN